MPAILFKPMHWTWPVLFVASCVRPTPPELTAPQAQTRPKEMEELEHPIPVQSSFSIPTETTAAKNVRTRRTLDERFLFQPSDALRGNYRPEQLRFEDVWFRADDGTKLHGWLCPCENPRAFVLFAHGNSGNLSFWSSRMTELQRDYRVSVFIFDYRGYGRSAGTPTVPGVLQDARAAAREFARRVNLEESDLIVMGQSLGGAVAVQLAAEIQPRGLILESTFSSFRDVADHHAKWASWLVPRGKLDSQTTIRNYRGPVLQCHGDADRVVPFESGEKLFQAANEPKTFVKMPGGGHHSPLTKSYRWALDDFFAQLARK